MTTEERNENLEEVEETVETCAQASGAWSLVSCLHWRR